MESESQGCVLAVLVSLDDSFVDLPKVPYNLPKRGSPGWDEAWQFPDCCIQLQIIMNKSNK
jgi:hypothetical protein